MTSVVATEAQRLSSLPSSSECGAHSPLPPNRTPCPGVRGRVQAHSHLQHAIYRPPPPTCKTRRAYKRRQARRSLGLPRPATSTCDCWERLILGPGNQQGSETLCPKASWDNCFDRPPPPHTHPGPTLGLCTASVALVALILPCVSSSVWKPCPAEKLDSVLGCAPSLMQSGSFLKT